MRERLTAPALLLLLALLIPGACARAEVETADVLGEWVGEIQIMGQPLGFEVEFFETPQGLAGTMSIPTQGLRDGGLTEVSWDPPELGFTLPVPGAPARYEGTVEEGLISGEFNQSGYTGLFELRPYVAPVLDYPTEEVRIATDHGPVLAGTLSLPEDDGPHPAVLLITGSGAQDRDEDIYGFKPFFLLADHLTNQGYAVLRCDDRGFADSTGDISTATSADLALDYAAQLRYLEERAEVDPERVYLLGHSEGSIIAGMLAAEYDVAGVIMFAGQAVPGDELLLAQSAKTILAEGGTAEDVAWNQDFQRRAYDKIRNDGDLEPLYNELDAVLREQYASFTPAEQAAFGDVDTFVETQLAQQRTMLESPWTAYFIDYDPWTHLAAVDCPILAVFGELDVQVPPDLNIAALEAGAAEYDLTVSIETIAGANHLFQTAESGGLSEYPLLEKDFAPGVLETITAWLDAQ